MNVVLSATLHSPLGRGVISRVSIGVLAWGGRRQCWPPQNTPTTDPPPEGREEERRGGGGGGGAGGGGGEELGRMKMFGA